MGRVDFIIRLALHSERLTRKAAAAAAAGSQKKQILLKALENKVLRKLKIKRKERHLESTSLASSVGSDPGRDEMAADTAAQAVEQNAWGKFSLGP